MGIRIGNRIIILALSVLAVSLLISIRPSAVRRYLTVAFNPNLPPYQFAGDDGSLSGMHIDMLDAIAESRNLTLEYLPMESDLDCIDALRSGEADMILGMRSDEGAGLRLTDPLTTSSLCMVVETVTTHTGNGAGEKPPYTAVFEYGMTPYTIMMNLGIEQYFAVGNQRQLFERYRQLGADALIGVRDSLLYQIEQSVRKEDYTVLHNHLGTVSYAIMLRAEDRELLGILNNGIAQIKASRQYDSIYDRWTVTADGNRRMEIILRNMLIGTCAAAVAVMGYVLVTSQMRGELKRRVEAQTREIKAANSAMETQLAQIRNESELRRIMLRHSPSGMLLLDTRYIITLMNKSAGALIGAAKSISGECALELPVFGDILADIRRELGEDLFQAGKALENRSVSLPHRSGELRSYRCSMHQVVSLGAVTGVLLIVQDVTLEEKEKREAFEEGKNRALGRIVAGIAHEIRNPLTSIRTFATLIGTQGDDRQVQESFARYVPAEVDRINKLIESLINYARPIRRDVRRTSVSELIDGCIQLLGPSLRLGDIRLESRIQKELFIRADRDQIKQVLINLMMNGIEAMEKKLAQTGTNSPLTLEISAAAEGGSAVIRIRDEGVGMSWQEREHCADPFYTTKEKGIGIGMSLCEQFVDDNSGSMLIDSKEMEYTEITLVFGRDLNEAEAVNN